MWRAVTRFVLLRCFFFNDTATTEIYTLSLHDALPIYAGELPAVGDRARHRTRPHRQRRSEEHTSELQSRGQLVCRLLLENKKDDLRENRRVRIQAQRHTRDRLNANK